MANPGQVFTFNEPLARSALKLGDVIECSVYYPLRTSQSQVWDTATVVNVTATEITLFRPYVITADFSYTGGIIPYLGFEQFTMNRDANHSHFVYTRKELA